MMRTRPSSASTPGMCLTRMCMVQLEAGLENKSSLLMIPTMVDMLPQGCALGLSGLVPACLRPAGGTRFPFLGRRTTQMAATWAIVLGRHESGEYYAIDLGGTNLRVLFTRLGKGPKEIVSPQRHSCCHEPQDECSAQQGVELTCRLAPCCA